jgi:CRP-like cAMP-binding protein
LPGPDDDAQQQLSRNPILAGLGQACRARLAEGAEIREWTARQPVYGQGEAADRLFLVLRGWVEMALDDASGSRTLIETIGPPRLAGGACAVAGATYAHSCEAGAVGARLMALEASVFRAGLGESPGALKAMLAQTSVALRRLVGQLGDLKLKDSVQRLAGFLVELSPDGARSAEIVLPMEKRIIADRLGMKPETLSRALARLDAMGLAHAADSATLRVPDVSGLRHLYLAGEEGARS